MNIKEAATYGTLIVGSLTAMVGGYHAYFAVLDGRYAAVSTVQAMDLEVSTLGQAVLRDQIWRLQDQINRATSPEEKRVLEERLRQVLAEYCQKYDDGALCG